MTIISDYKHDDTLRGQLNELARKTFSLDFEAWYRAGFWDERYVPYSIAEDGRIAANVSANRVELAFEGRRVPAVLIGTVMTDPAYRGRGYAARLLRHVLTESRRYADVVYLFANETVLDFYPKFGFALVEEHQCALPRPAQAVPEDREELRKLNIDDARDLAILTRLLDTGIPAPKRLSVPTIRALVLFYCQSVYQSSVYYSARRDLMLFYHDGVLLDYFSSAPVSLREAAACLPGDDKLTLGFTPPDDDKALLVTPYDDHLFVHGTLPFDGRFMFPALSRA